MMGRDPYADVLKQAAEDASQDDSDVVREVVVDANGQEHVLSEIRRELEWVVDPVTGKPTVPLTVTRRTHYLDATGRVIQGKGLGMCSAGCLVPGMALKFCVVCRRAVCQAHGLLVKKRVYCSRRWCRIRGRIRWSFGKVMRLVVFVVRSILGYKQRPELEKSEEEWFTDSYNPLPEQRSLNDEERR